MRCLFSSASSLLRFATIAYFKWLGVKKIYLFALFSNLLNCVCVRFAFLDFPPIFSIYHIHKVLLLFVEETNLFNLPHLPYSSGISICMNCNMIRRWNALIIKLKFVRVSLYILSC